MASILPLFIALATASPATLPRDDVGSVLDACSKLPIERQRACVEPFLDQLPPEIARMVRFETDPAIHAANQRWHAEMDASLRAHASRLAARGGARNLLAAALLWPPTPPVQGPPVAAPEARRWFAEAQDSTPSDPIVDWLEATDCGGLADECDRGAALARLLVADPDNAAVHLLALRDAERRGDAAGVARHLQAAARAKRYATFFTPMLELIIKAHDGIAWPTPDPALGEALAAMWGTSAPVEAGDFAAVQAAGRAMAVAYPGLGTVTMLCPADGSGNPAMLDDCTRLYALVADSTDTLIDELIALVQLSQLTAGEARGDAWREQLRHLYWVQERALQQMPGAPGSGITAGDYMRLFVQEGEVAAMREVLHRKGIATTPPADWLPEPARQRALVTTGVPARR